MDLKEASLIFSENNQAKRHPWEVARRNHFLNLVSTLYAAQSKFRILDIGAGDGWFAQGLMDQFPQSEITLFDPHFNEDIKKQIQSSVRPSHPGQLTLTKSLPADQNWDLILMLDVLEHIENDLDFLRTLTNQVGSNQTRFLVSVPAFQKLYSNHDKFLGHFRRYNPNQIRTLIKQAGLIIQRSGGLFTSLLVPAYYRARKDYNEAEIKTLHWDRGPLVSTLVTSVLATDSILNRMTSKVGLDMPGLSWWCICVKDMSRSSIL